LVLKKDMGITPARLINPPFSLVRYMLMVAGNSFSVLNRQWKQN